MGAERTSRLRPARRRDRGSKVQGRTGRRGITRPAQADFRHDGCDEHRIRAEGRGDHPGRRGLPRFTLDRARGQRPQATRPASASAGAGQTMNFL